MSQRQDAGRTPGQARVEPPAPSPATVGLAAETQEDHLRREIDALLAQDVDGAAEADVLEQAQRLVADALGDSSA